MRPAKSEAIQYAATKPGAPIGENDSLGAILERGLSRPWMPSKYGFRAPNLKRRRRSPNRLPRQRRSSQLSIPAPLNSAK